MERLPLYLEHAERLIRAGKAYRCWCTRDELQAQREALKAKDPKAEFRYPGTCRDRKDEPGGPSVVRFRTPTEGALTYRDMVFGEVTTPNSAQQDFVLLRSDGVPLYNFGAVVDDVTMDISIVARGRDHMVNTPPQIMIYEALGAPVPRFAHLPMMLNQKGAKLSKRDGAVGVFEYRDLGYAPEAVLNYLVRFGWSHGDQEVFSKAELVEAFNWEACGRGDGKFDAKKFLAVDHEHLKSARLVPDDEYAHRTVPFLHARGRTNATEDAVKRVLRMIRERATTFADAAERLDFLFRDAPEIDPEAARKFLGEEGAARLRGLLAALEDGAWTEPELDARTNAFLAANNLQIKDVAQSARVALTGKTASPGLFQVMWALGRDATLARLRAGAELGQRA
jgi:glutamyl-tRNA synthetase